MKALVTGGSGFLGKAIVKKLLDKGADVRVLNRKFSPDLKKLGVEVVQSDLIDAPKVIRACEGRDVIFHVAAKVDIGVTSYQDFFNVNCQGTQNIIDGCHHARVSKLVYTSSPSVISTGQHLENANEEMAYPAKFQSFYQETKARAEQMVLAANAKRSLSTVALRPHLIYGPGDTNILPRLMERARMRKLIQVGTGQNLIDLTYIDNAASAHILAAEKLEREASIGGRAFFITDDHPVNLWDWINALVARLELPPIRKKISYRTAYLMGSIFEKLYSFLKIKKEPLMTCFVAAQLAKSHYFDISRAKRELGYIPLVSGDEGFKRTVAYFKDLA